MSKASSPIAACSLDANSLIKLIAMIAGFNKQSLLGQARTTRTLMLSYRPASAPDLQDLICN